MAEHEIDAKTFFGGIDFTSDATPTPNDVHDKPLEHNEFEGFESKLNLPLGSTKEAIQSAKQLVAQTKSLSAEADMLQLRDENFDDIQGEEINDEVLRQDRARIRKEAHELYSMGKNMLLYMYDQLKTTINPGDKMWASVANMITSVSNSLTNLNKMTKDFREENDKDLEKRVQAGEVTDETQKQEYDMTPEKMNKIIANWVSEDEAKRAKELKETADNNIKRLADQSSANAMKEIEHNG